MPQESFLRHMRERPNPYKGFFSDNLFKRQMDDDYLPAANIQSTSESYEIQLALPGFKKEHVEISIAGNVLTIKGEEVIESKVTENFTQKEFYQSAFQRSFDLPPDVKEEISAHFEDGVLKVSIGRHDHDPKLRSHSIGIN